MSAMMAAIKKRKMAGAGLMGDHQDATHPGEHVNDADQGKDLHGLVSSLSESEKHSLRTILEKDKVGGNAQAIAKGAPSTEEQGKIAQASAKENQTNALEEAEEQEDGPSGHLPQDQSDEIAKSMLDSSHLRGTASTSNPRNLGERMKQSVAAKLKAKGKI